MTLLIEIFMQLAIRSAAADEARAASSAPAAPGEAPSGTIDTNSTPAKMQECLDQMRRRDLDAKKKLAVQKPNSGAAAVPYTFQKVAPAQLPSSCPAGDISAFRKTLQDQIDSCRKSSTSVAAAAIKPLCAARPAPDWCADEKRLAAKIEDKRLELGDSYNAKATIKIGCRTFTRKEWCGAANAKMLELANSAKDFTSFMESAKTQFDWYKSDGKPADSPDQKIKKGEVQFTAYYSPPPIEASVQPTDQFKYPIYRRPSALHQMTKDDNGTCGSDPISGNKYKWCIQNGDGSFTAAPTREDIDKNHALKNDALIIAYVKDPVDIAMLMVEGSGAMRINTLEGKKVIRLNYDGQNGRTRYMLSRILKCDGAKKEETLSEEAIRKYLAAHPDRAASLLNFDQSYIFFKTADKGPFGSEGVILSERHSIATDPEVIPLGSVSMFNVDHPPRDKSPCSGTTSMAVSQDTGGAIGGAHIDWYMGDGANAKASANDFNHPGAVFIALPPKSGEAIPGCSGKP